MYITAPALFDGRSLIGLGHFRDKAPVAFRSKMKAVLSISNKPLFGDFISLELSKFCSNQFHAYVLIENAWLKMAQWEKQKHKPTGQEFRQYQQELDLAEENLLYAKKQAQSFDYVDNLQLLKLNVDLDRDLGRLYYLRGKSYYLLDPNDKKTGEFYSQSLESYNRAIGQYEDLGLSFSRAHTARFRAILLDQKYFHKLLPGIINRDFIIDLIESEAEGITAPVNQGYSTWVYRLLFQGLALVTGSPLLLRFARQEGAEAHKTEANLKEGFQWRWGKPIKSLANLSKLKFQPNFLLVLLISIGVLTQASKWIADRSISLLLTAVPLGSLPGWLGDTIFRFLRFAVQEENLVQCFDSKGNLYHDLDKAARDGGDPLLIKAANHYHRQTHYYLTHLDQLLDSEIYREKKDLIQAYLDG
ncbi:MAG: hypothetical protein SFT81_01110 [Candidatus Caenarcaniphilales bacterium]|nr:hypothetical protein [Candidatus Caenarcaniphilales bacterium]